MPVLIPIPWTFMFHYVLPGKMPAIGRLQFREVAAALGV